VTAPAGRRNRLVSVQRRSTGVDSQNQPLDTWEVVKTLWADIKGQTGMGSIRGGEHTEGVATNTSAYSFRVNHNPTAFDRGMRVAYGGAFFNIVDIRHDIAKREWTDLVCTTGDSDG